MIPFHTTSFSIRRMNFGALGVVIVFASAILAGSACADTRPTVDLPTIDGPLTLQEAIQTALKYSPMVQSAQAQVSAAQARIGMAKSMTRPQLGVSGFAGNSTMGDIITSPPNVMPSSIFTVPSTTAITGQAALMIPIFTGGRLQGTVGSAKSLFTAVATDKASVEGNTALETKTAYHAALLAHTTVDVYRNLVTEEKERVRIAEAAFKEGKIAKYDLLRNRAGLADSEQQLANAERDDQLALVELKAVLGLNQASDVTLKDQLGYVQVTGTLDSYVASAIEKRPELAAARARVKSAESSVGVAKSAYDPQVYAVAMGGASASSRDNTSGFTAGVTIGIPLVDGGQRRSAVQEAESMLAAMKQDEKQSLVGIQKDVYSAWAEVQAAEKNVTLSEAAVDQAREDYRVIKLRYESGKAVNVEVLDALASLTKAENNRAMALYEHNVARDRLARAIGEI